jgi:hypothetical protein
MLDGIHGFGDRDAVVRDVQKVDRHLVNFQRLPACGCASEKILCCQAPSNEGYVRVRFGADGEFGGEILVTYDGFGSAISLCVCEWLFLDRQGKGRRST